MRIEIVQARYNPDEYFVYESIEGQPHYRKTFTSFKKAEVYRNELLDWECTRVENERIGNSSIHKEWIAAEHLWYIYYECKAYEDGQVAKFESEKDADAFCSKLRAGEVIFLNEEKGNKAGVSKEIQYTLLRNVLDSAYKQASDGKGKERHASGESFEEQPICAIARQVGQGFTRGQAIKKIIESQRLPKDRSIAELYGAINYIAATIILIQEEDLNDKEAS